MQCLPAIIRLRQTRPTAEIHFLTRSDFADVVDAFRATDSLSRLDRVWRLDRVSGWRGLWRLIRELQQERFTHIYDAHSNLRTFFIRTLLRWNSRAQIVRRPKNRFKRFLLFYLRKNLFSAPFRGVDSYLDPLRKWLGESTEKTSVATCRFDFSRVELPIVSAGARSLTDQNYIAIVPGAAWPLKEWPKEHWQKLLRNLSLLRTTAAHSIVVLGGKDDRICAEICDGLNAIGPTASAPTTIVPCLNLAGQLTWLQCLKIIEHASVVVAADTGLMHAADLLARPTLALIGPTAFGFPQKLSSRVLDVPLSCRPCTKDGRGRCRNSEYKACMNRIEPERVADAVREIVNIPMNAHVSH